METNIQKAGRWLREAEALLVTASNGLSIAEGYHIFADNEDFRRYFGRFRDTYGIDCLIRGVFAPLPPVEHEAYMVVVHRYLIEDYHGSDVMKDLLDIIGSKDYMTPMFIQEPFWALVNSLPRAKYITVNAEYAFLPAAIEDKGMAIRQDIGKTLADCRRKITALH